MVDQILWTLLPKMYETEGNSLIISLFVSPRLQSTSPYTLAQFDRFLDWPALVQEMSYHIHLGNNVIVEAERLGPTPNSAWWQALFPADTPVLPFKYRNLSKHRIRAFPVGEIVGFLKKQYQTLGLNNATELPPISQLLAADSFGSIHIAPYVDYMQIPTGTVEAELAAFLEETLKRHQHVPPGTYPPGKKDAFNFYQARAFFEPPPSLQDTSANPQPPADLDPPDLEFHQRLTALANYPELLRHLGLIIDLRIALADNVPHQGATAVCRLADSVGAANDLRPWTKYQFDGTIFLAQPKTGNSPVQRGFLTLADPRYQVIQVDADGAALKSLNFTRSLAWSQGHKSADSPEKAGVPTLRSTGLALVENDRAGQMVSHFAQSQKHDKELNSGSKTFYADDLIRGFRLDVWYEKTQSWHSLCRRIGNYSFLATGQETTLTDEGIVSAAATQMADGSQPDDLYMHESLVAWRGWSLVVPRPGRLIGHEKGEGDGLTDQDGNDGAEVLGLATHFTVPNASLPRLRYGHSYRLRARATDLAGNSLPLSNEAEQDATPLITFLRYESIDAPALVPRQPLDQSPGESVAHLVVRSNFDEAATSGSERHIVPPRVAQLTAEFHEMFDTPAGLNKADYNTIINHEGDLPDHEAGSLSLPYLPDPIARGASWQGLPGLPTDQTENVFYDVSQGWPQIGSLRLRLEEGSTGYTVTGNLVTVRLNKAEVLELKVASLMNELDLGLLGVWEWLREAAEVAGSNVEKHRKQALNGRKWLLTPPQRLTLVHAVRQPLERPDFINLTSDRGLGFTYTNLEGEVFVDGASTLKLDVQGEWQEWVDRPEVSPPEAPHQVTVKGHAFEFPVTVKDKETKLLVYDPETKEYIPPRHEFGDTKYRLVHYSAVATTRFREYFTDAQAPFTRETAEVTSLDVYNTARPPTPQIVYVLPTFAWEEEPPDDNSLQRRRRSGLRVYLERPWYQSGDGELLGVVLHQGVVPDHLRPLTTLWGDDPIWLSNFPIGDAPTVTDFPMGVHVEHSLTLAERQDSIAGNQVVSVVGHSVSYDSDRDLWYCDLAIDSHAAYLPFVRLALVRYQPHSVHNAHLSRVMLADFVQLTPERTATIVLDDPASPSSAQVTVSGYTYSANHLGAGSSEVEVTVERRQPLIQDETLGWEAVKGKTVALKRVPGRHEPPQWQGMVPLPEATGERLRLMIKEYERYQVDGAPQLTSHPNITFWPTKRRLVYADAVEING